MLAEVKITNGHPPQVWITPMLVILLQAQQKIPRVTGEGSCGGRDAVSVTISIDDFAFSLGPNIAICEGIAGVTLDAGNIATAYLWNTGQTSQIINIDDEGIYSVTVTSPGAAITQTM